MTLKELQELKNRHQQAKERLKIAFKQQQVAREAFNKATNEYQLKASEYQTFDLQLAELKFAEQNAKAIKQKAKRPAKAKTAEQAMADVMLCLKALPLDQRNAVLASMQGGSKND